MSAEDALVAPLEAALNRLLALDPEARRDLADLQGRVIRFDILGLGLQLWLVPGAQGVQVYPRYDAEPDCVLRGTPLGFARLGLGERADELFKGAVEIEGDTALGERLGAILARLDIDWEELLSKVTGDPIAHTLGQGARAMRRQLARDGDVLVRDLSEYLQEEARLLPTRYEVDEFADAVDRLRDDAERLAARVERLQRLRPKPGDA